MAPTEPLVLVVDDETMLSGVLLDILADHGFQPSAVETGADALSAIAATRPAAVLLDVSMPGLDGWEVLRRLKRDQATRSIPVVMMTGTFIKMTTSDGIHLMAAGFLAKPFTPAQLVELLRQVTA